MQRLSCTLPALPASASERMVTCVTLRGARALDKHADQNWLHRPASQGYQQWRSAIIICEAKVWGSNAA